MAGLTCRQAPLSMRPLALALALGGGLVGGADAATNAEIAALLDKLNARVERLEQDNARLQRELAASRAQPLADGSAALVQRVQALEQQQAQLNNSLEAETISENEPALSARLKAVETQAASLTAPVAKLKALDGFKGGLSLSMVAQRSLGTAQNDKQLGYRADATVGLPLSPIGDVEQSLFAQVRLGQGGALNGLSSLSNPNATAFQLGGGLRADDSVALLAQAWYQADIALLSPVGFSRAHGATRFEHHEAAIARALARHVRRVIILADYSKFGISSRVSYVKTADIDTIVTDARAPCQGLRHCNGRALGWWWASCACAQCRPVVPEPTPVNPAALGRPRSALPDPWQQGLRDLRTGMIRDMITIAVQEFPALGIRTPIIGNVTEQRQRIKHQQVRIGRAQLLNE